MSLAESCAFEECRPGPEFRQAFFCEKCLNHELDKEGTYCSRSWADGELLKLYSWFELRLVPALLSLHASRKESPHLLYMHGTYKLASQLGLSWHGASFF